MQKYRVSLDDIEQTKNLAIFFANKVNKGSVILLKGDLGSGKTTFAQFFIYEICGIKDVVTSPTFNLVHQYKSVNFDLWHFDLYRLKNIEEVFVIVMLSGVLQLSTVCCLFYAGGRIDLALLGRQL